MKPGMTKLQARVIRDAVSAARDVARVEGGFGLWRRAYVIARARYIKQGCPANWTVMDSATT